MQTSQQLALLLLLVGALVAVLPKLVVVRRRKPEDRERLRRLRVNQNGRLGDALINDVQDGTIFYSYQIAGVNYSAAQDVSGLQDRLPREPERLGGFAKLKYEARNPANSIIVCEKWSGLLPPASKSAPSDFRSRPASHEAR